MKQKYGMIVNFITGLLITMLFILLTLILLLSTLNTMYILDDNNATATSGNILDYNNRTIILSNYTQIGYGKNNMSGDYIMYTRSDEHEVIYVYIKEDRLYTYAKRLKRKLNMALD